jgi:hypothetical protein
MMARLIEVKVNNKKVIQLCLNKVKKVTGG